jgi:hypothetical protein
VSIESIMEPQICASSVVKVGVKGPSVEDLADTSRCLSCVRSRRARCEDSIMTRNLRACASVLVRSGYTLKTLVGSPECNVKASLMKRLPKEHVWFRS